MRYSYSGAGEKRAGGSLASLWVLMGDILLASLGAREFYDERRETLRGDELALQGKEGLGKGNTDSHTHPLSVLICQHGI